MVQGANVTVPVKVLAVLLVEVALIAGVSIGQEAFNRLFANIKSGLRHGKANGKRFSRLSSRQAKEVYTQKEGDATLE